MIHTVNDVDKDAHRAQLTQMASLPQLWNYMSWERTREEDVKRSLKVFHMDWHPYVLYDLQAASEANRWQAFDVTYSLNGKHWFPLGRVEGLPAIPSTGIFKSVSRVQILLNCCVNQLLPPANAADVGVCRYYGECIQNKSAGGKDAMPFAHRKAALVEVRDDRP